jgi:phenylacetate-CoA ligase
MKEIFSALERYSWQKLNKEIVAPLFKKQFQYVIKNSPFYQKKIGKHLINKKIELSDLVSLPFTEKQELLNDEKTNPPFGSYLATPLSRVARVHRTSGSSGQVLFLALSKNDIENTLECGARCFWSAGLRPHDIVIHCLNYCMWAGGITDHQSLERTGAGVIPFGVGNTSDLIRTILNLKPSAIHCTPSYLSKLELLLSEEFKLQPHQLGLKLGLFGGEGGLQDKEFRRNIERKWRFKAMDANYGVSEVLSMFGAECKVREGLHFMGQGVIYPEIKNLKNDEILPWEKGVKGELVITNLSKECQPLLRYRTHDIVEIVSIEKCRCGRLSPRFIITGRLEDVMVIKGINVFLSSIAEVINQKLDILTGEFQVLVNRKEPIERIVIKVEVKKDKLYPLLSNELQDCFKKTIFIKPEIEIVPEGSISSTGNKIQRIERIL